MLATLVIGLREGLEAALIVSIVAAFLRRNSKSLKPMWLGVALAVLLSLAVGVVLEVVSASLPQAQQEGMETVIGAIAVVMVTAMILWMRKNARNLKSELESSAAAALGRGSTGALAVMAFLAVLREGVETAVFLLAAFQSSVNPLLAGLGALIGVVIAIAIGYGIFGGGVRLNLGRFFSITGIFLVLVAAGLVLKSLRTAHEAGWLTVGQGRTLDLSWLAPNGAWQTALITGVLGIPADPHVVELWGWLLYLIPMLIFVLWPAKRSVKPANQPRLYAWIAVGCAVVAVGMFAASFAFASTTPKLGSLPLDGGGAAELSAGGDSISAPGTKPLALGSHGVTEQHAGVEATHYQVENTGALSGLPQTLTLDQLEQIGHGRLPLGVNPQLSPGPFQATWQPHESVDVWVADGQLLDASASSDTTLKLSGGGMSTAKIVSADASAVSKLSDAAPAVFSASEQSVASRGAALAQAQSSVAESLLYRAYLPVIFAVAALWFGTLAVLRRRREVSSTTQGNVPTAQNPTSHSAEAIHS